MHGPGEPLQRARGRRHGAHLREERLRFPRRAVAHHQQSEPRGRARQPVVHQPQAHVHGHERSPARAVAIARPPVGHRAECAHDRLRQSLPSRRRGPPHGTAAARPVRPAEPRRRGSRSRPPEPRSPARSRSPEYDAPPPRTPPGSAASGARHTAANPASASRTRAGKPERSIDDDSAGCDTGMGPLPRLALTQHPTPPLAGRSGSRTRPPASRDRDKIRPSNPRLSPIAV